MKDTTAEKPSFEKGQKIIVTSLHKEDKNQGIKIGDCGILVSRSKDNHTYWETHFIEGNLKGKKFFMFEDQIEHFITPKFAYGYKFKSEGQTFQVVAVKLNKKMKTYVYMLYCMEHGCPSVILEADIPTNVKVKPTIELTRSQAGQKLAKLTGKKVIIKN